MTPTPSEINRRLAEFAGATNFHVQWGIPACEIKSITVPVPDYYHSADAVLPLVERVCRERGLRFDASVEHGEWDAKFIKYGREIGTHYGDTLASIVCLALVAVLDGDSKNNNERTEP